MFKIKHGFTLAEMMVVMLILSIVLAAMAPVMTTRNKTDYSSPWRYASNGSDAYFAGNSNSNQVAMIGQHEVGTGEDNARLILRTSSGSGWSHLMFKTGDTIVGRLYLDESNLYLSNVTNPSGSESTSVGVGALTQNTGENNTAIGNEALHNNTSGIMNTAIGSFSLRDTNTGSNNIGVGTFSLTENTTGSGNVAIGTNALQHNTTGTDNIAIGTNANYGAFTTAAYKTIAIGNQSAAYSNGAIAIGSSLTSSEGGTAYNGAYASGERSTAIGNGSNSTGEDSLAIGSSTQAINTSAIAIGNKSESSGELSIAVGTDSTKSYGENSIAIGRSAQTGISIDSDSGINAIAIGPYAKAQQDVTSSYTDTSNGAPIAIGYEALSDKYNSIAIGSRVIASGSHGIAIGSAINYYNVHTSHNIIGKTQATGSTSIAIGTASIASEDSSIAIGSGASSNAPNGIAIGADTHAKRNGVAIGLGANAGKNDVEWYNTAIGAFSCQYLNGASKKTCIGFNSGPKSGSNWASDDVERIFIGSQSKFDGGTAVLEVHNTNEEEGHLRYYGDDINQTAVVVHGALVVSGPIYARTKRDGDRTGRLWKLLEFDDDKAVWSSGNTAPYYRDYLDDTSFVSSDRRLKYVSNENKAGLDKIRQLKVFNYTFKKDEKKTPHVGVIAQDLQKVFPNAVKKGVDGFLTIRMEDMFYAVINAIKELDSRVTRLEKENQELKVRIERLEAKIK